MGQNAHGDLVIMSRNYLYTLKGIFVSNVIFSRLLLQEVILTNIFGIFPFKTNLINNLK